MKIESNTYFNIKDIDNVQFFGDIFLDYPSFNNVMIIGATYKGVDMDEQELNTFNRDKGLVQAICLDYLNNVCDLDNVY